MEADAWIGTLVLLTAIVVPALAPIVVIAAAGIARFAGRRVDRVLVGVVLAVTILGAGAALVLGGPLAALVVLGVVAALAGAPLALGWWLAETYAPVPRAVGRRWVAFAWPVALAVAFAGFVAPGGVARYNVLFLTSPLRELVLVALYAIVLLGPGVLVATLGRRSPLAVDDAA